MKKNKAKKIKKKNNSKNGLKIFLLILLFIAIVTMIYFYLNSNENNKLSLFEKQWIDKNKSTLINIEIPNNISVYGENGEGVLFDYVNSIEEETNLTFNKISYNYPSGQTIEGGLRINILSSNDIIKKDDVLIAEDKYVLASLNEKTIIDFENEPLGTIGILTSDKEIFTSIYSNNNYTFKTYNSLDNLVTALKEKDVKYIGIPRHYALTKIISNKLYINYDFNSISNKIVLKMSTNEKLNSVAIKNLNIWKESQYEKSYQKELMNFYVNNLSISELDKESLSSKVFNYGFVDNSSYNILKSKELYGVAGEYINVISSMADVDINYIKYETKKDLIEAINKKEVDIAFINFEFDNQAGYKVYPNLKNTLVGLSKEYISLDNTKGLTNRKIYLLDNDNLTKYLNDNVNANINKTTSIKDEIKDGILVLDEVDYLYNKNDYLNGYNVVLKNLYQSSDYFYIENDEKVLYDTMNFISMYADNDTIKNEGLTSLLNTKNNQNNFDNLYILILAIILIPIMLVLLSIIITKTITKFKVVRKEDILKYNDMLTSLKNRNYLNAHIDEWDENTIYPSSIIMMDLNNLKYVNDNYSHKEGNNLIKKAAAILINTQLEKSEIIRTDGNEFLIYLVGYNEPQVKTYLTKLTKEFEKLPYGFGAAMGYSMIEDEIKTIDDAINEASIAMRKDKKENYK